MICLRRVKTLQYTIFELFCPPLLKASAAVIIVKYSILPWRNFSWRRRVLAGWTPPVRSQSSECCWGESVQSRGVSEGGELDEVDLIGQILGRNGKLNAFHPIGKKTPNLFRTARLASSLVSQIDAGTSTAHNQNTAAIGSPAASRGHSTTGAKHHYGAIGRGWSTQSFHPLWAWSDPRGRS